MMEQHNEPSKGKALETNHVFCAVCDGCCLIERVVQDGKVLRLKGLPSHPLAPGAICRKLIVLAPIKSHTAKRADIHLPLHPGTDAAMALGWLHVIIEEALYHKDFVADWTVGFEKLRERVREYPLHKVQEIINQFIHKPFADDPGSIVLICASEKDH